MHILRGCYHDAIMEFLIITENEWNDDVWMDWILKVKDKL